MSIPETKLDRLVYILEAIYIYANLPEEVLEDVKEAMELAREVRAILASLVG